MKGGVRETGYFSLPPFSYKLKRQYSLRLKKIENVILIEKPNWTLIQINTSKKSKNKPLRAVDITKNNE